MSTAFKKLGSRGRWVSVAAVLATSILGGGCGDDPWASEDPKIRLAAVAETTDQQVLARLAIEDDEADVRAAATSKVNDQQLLESIAIEDKSEAVRLAAVNRLHDPAALSRLVTASGDAAVRLAALSGAMSPAVIADAALQDADNAIRLRAVETLSDQVQIARVIANTDDRDVRKAAIGKLSDWGQILALMTRVDATHRADLVECIKNQAWLTKLATSDRDPSVRSRAVKRLEDQATLAGIAIEDEVRTVRFSARGRLKDPAMLAHVAGIVTDDKEAQDALNEINDEKWVAHVALTAHTIQRRCQAVGRLKSERQLAHVADQSTSPIVSRRAINQLLSRGVAKLTDPLALEVVGFKATKSVDRVAALNTLVDVATDAKLHKRVTHRLKAESTARTIADGRSTLGVIGQEQDAEVLFIFAYSQDLGASHERMRAAGRVTDKAHLNLLARGAAYPDVRAKALASVDDTDLLRETAVFDEAQNCRIDAMRRLSDPNVLARFAANRSNGAFRYEALERINDSKALGKVAAEKDNVGVIARIKLALLEPELHLEGGPVRIKVQVRDASRRYGNPYPTFTLPGEDIQLAFLSAEQVIIEREFKSKFPIRYKFPGPNPGHEPVRLDPIELLTSVIAQKRFFSHVDWNALLESTEVSDLRKAIIAHLRRLGHDVPGDREKPDVD